MITFFFLILKSGAKIRKNCTKQQQLCNKSPFIPIIFSSQEKTFCMAYNEKASQSTYL